MVNIAVLGYGVVGSGVYEVLNVNKESITKKTGDEINIKYILDLREFPGNPAEKLIVHDFDIIANDSEIDIVVGLWAEQTLLTHMQREVLKAARTTAHQIKSLWLSMVLNYLN